MGNVEMAECVEKFLAAVKSDRALMSWDVCRDVLANARAYAPADFSPPKEWGEASHRAVSKMRSISDLDELRSSAEVEPVAFGSWRDMVLNHEALEANKLQTIMWCLRTLYALRDAGHLDESAADQVSLGLGRALEMDWRCKTIPLEGDVRPWAVIQTRRYDLLPKSWRYV